MSEIRAPRFSSTRSCRVSAIGMIALSIFSGVLILTADTQASAQGTVKPAHQAEHGSRRQKTLQTGIHKDRIKIGSLDLPLPDLELLDQNGKRVRFYTDLIKDKVVILSFFYTSCEYVCTMQGRNFAALQTKLGARMGKDVFLILVTRDPQVDTPQKLKKWGTTYGVKHGWTLVTGGTKEVERLIGIFTGDKPGPVEAHSTGIYIGNDAKGAWIYSDGLSAPDLLIKSINQLLE